MLRKRPMLLALARELTLPIARNYPVETMPAAIGSLHNFSLPRGTRPRPRLCSGGANINLILRFASETRDVPGEIAQCGVYRGGTLIPLGLFVRQRRIAKRVLGFDSFEGFDPSDARTESTISDPNRREDDLRLFRSTSFEQLCATIRKLRLASTIQLSRGFFRETLPHFAAQKFSFVHLDCDLYQPYADCLAFFYPRLSPGGILLLDEYNDPPWPGCNKAVDEFLRDKPEPLLRAESDNQEKWYFRRVAAD